MCNKRRKVINNNSTFSLLTIPIILLFVVTLFTAGCDRKLIYSYDFNTESFQQYEDAVQSRSYEKALALTEDVNQDIRRLAWYAVSRSQVDDFDELYRLVLTKNEPEPWLALSMNQVTDEKWQELYGLWINGEVYREGVCEVMAKQGRADAIPVLFTDQQYVLNSSKCSHAVGQIISRRIIETEVASEVFDLAFETDSPEIRRNLIYGFYRSRLNNLRREFQISDRIIPIWRAEIGINPVIDQMMLRIFGEPAMELVTLKWTRGGYKNNHYILLELVRTMYELDIVKVSPDLYKQLLSVDNHHVKQITLDLLRNLEEVDPELLAWISEEITGPVRNTELFIMSLDILNKNGVDIAPFKSKVEYAAASSPAYMNRILPLLEEFYTRNEFIDYLFNQTESDGLEGTYAMGKLGRIWAEGELDDNNTERFKLRIDRVFESGNYRMIGVLEAVFDDEDLYTDEEIWSYFNLIRSNDYEEWREFYETFVKVMHYRFGDDVTGELLELREINNYRLHRLLDHLEEEKPDFEGNMFRPVNWERLTELGSRPHWIIVTNRGTIEVELNPLNAPFTISALDSLTRAGAYNNVSFHRVVSNFVVQGGDVRMHNGSGSPAYVLPTEPSHLSFERGIAGMASSGVDTEGSQFFFMNQWGPHLDGFYTRFGKITRGMNVLDKMRIGDKVLSAEIQPR